MSKYVVFTEDQFEDGIEEMASMMYHGGFITRREIGPPVDDVVVIRIPKILRIIQRELRTTKLGAQIASRRVRDRLGGGTSGGRGELRSCSDTRFQRSI